ncbi:MAG: hypothetical protein HY047_00620 [Acidobacteria bacterium]|nr:hypothetical protein [Acidobacteriota bacterium]
MPGAFQVLYRADFWSLLAPRRTPEQRRMHYLQVVGRAKLGADVERARSNMNVVASDIARVSPELFQPDR